VWHDNDQRSDQVRRQDVRRKVLVIDERVVVIPQFCLDSGRGGLHFTEWHWCVQSYLRQNAPEGHRLARGRIREHQERHDAANYIVDARGLWRSTWQFHACGDKVRQPHTKA
jgi:hypothetical protein